MKHTLRLLCTGILCSMQVAPVAARNFRDTVVASSTDSILRYWLMPQTVSNDKPVANTFYFWTSTQELDTVADQNRLLRTTDCEECDEPYYSVVLRNSSLNQPLALHLMTGDRQRVRAAWPCYWSNIGAYNHVVTDNSQLVKVVLKDSALIVALDECAGKKERWKVYDLKGNVISTDEALRRKPQIAAVFYNSYAKVHLRAPVRTLTFSEYRRTFFLCNEDMIKSWHHAVPGLQAKMIRDLDYLVLLNAWFEDPAHCKLQGKKGKNCKAAWHGLQPAMQISDLFFATLRYASVYEPEATQESMKEILDTFRERWKQQKNPVERFPGARKQ